MENEILVRHEQNFLKPVISPKELIDYHKTMVEFIKDGLVEGVDYGTIPGTKTPTLYKPGAERLCKSFNVVPKFDVVASEKDHNLEVKWKKSKRVWNNAFKGDRGFTNVEEAGTSLGLYSYTIKCTLELPNGRTVAEGLGSCSTMETKYVDRPRDCENTVLKMAKKRAFVDATLTAFGLSNRFTQDLEEVYDSNHKTEQAVTDESTQERSAQNTIRPSERYTGSPSQVEALQTVLDAASVPHDKRDLLHQRMLASGAKGKDWKKILDEISTTN